MAHNVTDTTFEEEVLKSELPVLVDFWAEWCGPCKMLGPIIEQLSDELQGKVKIVKMDVDANPNVPSGLSIRGIPTMMLFKDGQMIGSKVGAVPKSTIEEWMNSLLA